MAGVTIAVGGRWREIESQNQELSSELAECQKELATRGKTEQDLCQRLLAATSRSSSLQAEARTQQDEIFAMQASLDCADAARTEMSAAMSVANVQKEELVSAKDALTEECQRLRDALSRVLQEHSQVKAELAAREQGLSLESSLRRKAEAKNQHQEAELQMLQGRYDKQSTHVQLLLREKERLWSQLSRSRQDKREDTKVAKEKATEVKAKENCKPRPKSCPKAPLRSDRSLLSADLERKLWHAQKALERERALHETTRLELAAINR